MLNNTERDAFVRELLVLLVWGFVAICVMTYGCKDIFIDDSKVSRIENGITYTPINQR